MPIAKYAQAAVINAREDYQSALLEYYPFTISYDDGTVVNKEANIKQHGLWFLDTNKKCKSKVEGQSVFRLV